MCYMLSNVWHVVIPAFAMLGGWEIVRGVFEPWVLPCASSL
ncbi:hypothetical protein T12_4470 [Trichinella patagoniensis]|uniref:Uncharacterized protein n=1 Tax=Trichinella patagoniensis TaxID=990121 RepID=A0A0V0YRD1_9BILA|nr:hypothetical protein T12_4470 [Trichinella patagoniensis]